MPDLHVLFGQILADCVPDCRVLDHRRLGGGISGQAMLVELERSGQRERVVVRCPGAEWGGPSAELGAREFRLLAQTHSAGIPVPRPIALHAATGTVVLAYVPGTLDFAPQDTTRSMHRLAECLVAIHRITSETAALEFLPQRALTAAASIAEVPDTLDESLGESELRGHLRRVWPSAVRNPSVLLHGDYWPGNVIWERGEVRAVIDWEESEVGDPLADVALTRLDLWWAYGEAAMHAFTSRYRELTTLDWRGLPHWELCVALRPMSRLARWADAYRSPAIERPDIDLAWMSAVHREFVKRALASLDVGVRALT